MQNKLLAVLSLCVLSVLSTGCNRSSGSAWEDTKTLGRYIQRGSKMLLKQNTDSRLIYDDDEFSGPVDEEFIPLNESEILSLKLAGNREPLQREIPSASEKNIPGLAAFKVPSSSMAQIFKMVHFHTDEHVIHEKEYTAVLDNISKYMKSHPEVYVFALGHCDERASESYNLALGTKRASYVRNYLVKNGVDQNHIFTLSFGKEIPLEASHTQEAWAKNRRVEFKIYEKIPGSDR